MIFCPCINDFGVVALQTERFSPNKTWGERFGASAAEHFRSRRSATEQAAGAEIRPRVRGTASERSGECEWSVNHLLAYRRKCVFLLEVLYKVVTSKFISGGWLAPVRRDNACFWCLFTTSLILIVGLRLGVGFPESEGTRRVSRAHLVFDSAYGLAISGCKTS